MGGKIEKPHGLHRRVPAGFACRRAAAPVARHRRDRSAAAGKTCWGPAVQPVWFFNFTTHRENKVKIVSKKVPDTQANPRYSAKNNVAIRMISTFIAKHNKIYNPDLLIYTCSNITFHNLNSTYPFFWFSFHFRFFLLFSSM